MVKYFPNTDSGEESRGHEKSTYSLRVVERESSLSSSYQPHGSNDYVIVKPHPALSLPDTSFLQSLTLCFSSLPLTYRKSAAASNNLNLEKCTAWGQLLLVLYSRAVVLRVVPRAAASTSTWELVRITDS